MWKRIAQFGSVNLLRSQISWLTSVQTNVLLQDEAVGELFMANGADVKEPCRWLGSMDAHMSFEVSFGSECSAAYFALERPLARVRSVLHLQRRLARQHPVAHDTLIRVH